MNQQSDNFRYLVVLAVFRVVTACCDDPTECQEKVPVWSEPIVLTYRDSGTYVAKESSRDASIYTPFPTLYLDNYANKNKWDAIGFHPGVDISASTGTPVYAVTDGTVAEVIYNDSWSNVVVIEHRDVDVYSPTGNANYKTTFYSIYAHLSDTSPSYTGQKVTGGDIIGYSGTCPACTGPHLHFQLDKVMPHWNPGGNSPFWPNGNDGRSLKTDGSNSVATSQEQLQAVTAATWDPMWTIHNQAPTEGVIPTSLPLRSSVLLSVQPPGESCSRGDECESGFCADGVCCDRLCDGSCEACNLQGHLGVCSNDDGARCQDGDACTSGDTCSAGACVSGAPTNCDDGSAGTDDRCEPMTGCIHERNALACDDGDTCTAGDALSGGVCVGSPVNCDDGNTCTDDSCFSATGCIHIHNTGPCEDGNACTAGDMCAAGVCVSGPLLTCDDSNVCTNDRCDPSRGCIYEALSRMPCEDGDPCTENDICLDGKCQSGYGPEVLAQVRFSPNPNGVMRAKYCEWGQCDNKCTTHDYSAAPNTFVDSPVYSILTYDPTTHGFVAHNDNFLPVSFVYISRDIPRTSSEGWNWSLCTTSAERYQFSYTLLSGAPYAIVNQVGGYSKGDDVEGFYGQPVEGKFQILAQPGVYPSCGATTLVAPTQ